MYRTYRPLVKPFQRASFIRVSNLIILFLRGDVVNINGELSSIKGDPKWAHCGIDTDIIVSNTRETSRKPDEVSNCEKRNFLKLQG